MKKADLLLMDAVIVTVDKDRRILYHGAMAVTDGRITEVGKTGELEIKYADPKEKIDCEGKIIFPGFINTHNHLFQTLLKGLAGNYDISGSGTSGTGRLLLWCHAWNPGGNPQRNDNRSGLYVSACQRRTE